MQEDSQSEEQKQALEDSLARGSAFEELIKTKGWEFVTNFYQAKIQHFASALLIEEKKPISDFENERRELIGLRKLIGTIENDIKILRDHQEKEKNAKKAERPAK